MLLAGRHEMSCTLAEYNCTPEERMSDFDTSYEIWKHSAKRPEMGKRPEAPSSSVSEDGVIHYVEGENAVIPKETIRDYFQLLPELKKFNSSMIDESEIEGRFDPVLGYYVLPADDEDEGDYDI